MIIAGDIGGTKALMAVIDDTGDQLKIVKEQRFASRNYSTFDEIAEEFAAALEPSVDRACFGIAGVIKNGRCTALNLPWVVDADTLATILGLQSVGLINDLEANAHGVPCIGGRSGGVPDAVLDGETGLLVDPWDEEELAAAIVRLLTDRDLASKLGQQGKERIAREMNWVRDQLVS